jgi:hypothetical protein
MKFLTCFWNMQIVPYLLNRSYWSGRSWDTLYMRVQLTYLPHWVFWSWTTYLYCGPASWWVRNEAPVWRPRAWYVLLSQGYCTRHGTVESECGAMVEWWLEGDNQRSRRNTCYIATSSTTSLTWSHPELNPGFRGEKPASTRLRCGTATLGVLNILIPMHEGKLEKFTCYLQSGYHFN